MTAHVAPGQQLHPIGLHARLVLPLIPSCQSLLDSMANHTQNSSTYMLPVPFYRLPAAPFPVHPTDEYSCRLGGRARLDAGATSGRVGPERSTGAGGGGRGHAAGQRRGAAHGVMEGDGAVAAGVQQLRPPEGLGDLPNVDADRARAPATPPRCRYTLRL